MRVYSIPVQVQSILSLTNLWLSQWKAILKLLTVFAGVEVPSISKLIGFWTTPILLFYTTLEEGTDFLLLFWLNIDVSC